MADKIKGLELTGFYRHQYRRLVGSSKARYGAMSETEVEDVVGDLFAELLERTDLMEQIENLSAYIYKAVGNKIIDYLRRRKKTISLDDPAAATVRPATGPAFGYDMQAAFEAAEIRSRIQSALISIKPEHRAVWEATEMEGFTFRELAREWNLPVGTLLARKHREVAELRKELVDLKGY